MKTYNQFLNTSFSEEVKPPEPQEEDPGIKSKEKRQMQIKKQVLLKKLQSVRAGAGSDIVASHTPDGEVLDELKSTTLLSYSNKAANQLAFKGDGSKKAQKRATGVKRAAGQLTMKSINKEEVNSSVQSALDSLNTYYAKNEKLHGSLIHNEDAALDFVKKKIEPEHGKGAYVSKDNPRKPQSAADNAKARAHQAKADAENAAARAKDPSQGRYPKG